MERGIFSRHRSVLGWMAPALLGLLLASCTEAAAPSGPATHLVVPKLVSPPPLGRLTGLELGTAKRRIHAMEPDAKINVVRRASSRRRGTVLAQSPARDSLVMAGMVVRLVVAKPQPPPQLPPLPTLAVTAICADGTVSYSQHASGTCSWHGGVRTWVNYPG
jgi:hypothetical protein